MNAADPRQAPGDQLQQDMQAVPLSPAQRARHRRLIASAFDARQSEAVRVRGKFELAVVTLALLCVAATALLWGSLADNEQDDVEQEALQATLIAREHATASALTTAVMAALPTYDAGACPATPYADSLPFGLPRQDPAFSDWYGSHAGGLWAAPVNRSVYRQSPISADTHWFAGEATYVLWYGSLEPLQFQGRQLDGEGFFAGSGAANSNTTMSTQWTTIEIPTPGCWSITARTRGTSLDIVVSVAPLAYRPDIVYLERVSTARPFDQPATCATSPVIGPESTSSWYVAAYAAQADDMLMSINQAWLTAERPEPLFLSGPSLLGKARVYGRRGDTTAQFSLRRTSSAGRFGDITFPSAGCWDIVVETPGQTTTFTAYVYPVDCAPVDADLRIPSSCKQSGT
jgi:hypothetical protein